MAYAAHPGDFRHGLASCHSPAATPAPRRGLLTRLLDTILADRERQAQRAVEDYLARTGHRLTDSIERELGERVINGGWNSRR